MRTDDILQIPADKLLAEELADEDCRDGKPYDGADGSAGHHSHLDGNGRAWAASEILFGAGRSQPSFSVAVSDAPAVVANSLPVRVVRQMSSQVINWVSRN
jgi:hypothetical protein